MSDEYIIHTDRLPDVEALAARLEAEGLLRQEVSATGFSFNSAARVSAGGAGWGATVELSVEHNCVRLTVNGYSPRKLLPLILDEFASQGVQAEVVEP